MLAYDGEVADVSIDDGEHLIDDFVAPGGNRTFFGGDDQRPASGALELRRRDGQPSQQVLSPSFQFENYDPEGPGPESLHALICACVGRPAYVGADHVVGLKTVRAVDAMYRSAASGKSEACA